MRNAHFIVMISFTVMTNSKLYLRQWMIRTAIPKLRHWMIRTAIPTPLDDKDRVSCRIFCLVGKIVCEDIVCKACKVFDVPYAHFEYHSPDTHRQSFFLGGGGGEGGCWEASSPSPPVDETLKDRRGHCNT